jgi:hypothetical protein
MNINYCFDWYYLLLRIEIRNILSDLLNKCIISLLLLTKILGRELAGRLML